MSCKIKNIYFDPELQVDEKKAKAFNSMLQELIMTTDASKIDDMYEPEKMFKPLKRSLS